MFNSVNIQDLKTNNMSKQTDYIIEYLENIEPVTDQEEIKKINNFLDNLILTDKQKHEENNKNFMIKIEEYQEINIICFIDKQEEIINISKGIIYKKRNSEEVYSNNFTVNQFNECFIFDQGNDYEIYQDEKLIFALEQKRSFEITNVITGEKSKLMLN